MLPEGHTPSTEDAADAITRDTKRGIYTHETAGWLLTLLYGVHPALNPEES